MSRASEHTVSAAQDTTSFRVEPTPVLATKKHIEFKSEPRLTETPTLRRRGTQQINTDPRGTVKVAQWVSSVPHVLPGMDDRVTAPPPKMASLFAAGGIGPKTLTPIKFEADPFDGTSDGLLRAVGTNRFGPAPQMASYNGVGGPLGRNTGPSALLRALTDGGKRKPTLEEAVDPKNLPLAEYCRLPKPDEFGVIRITNVSPSCPTLPINSDEIRFRRKLTFDRSHTLSTEPKFSLSSVATLASSMRKTTSPSISSWNVSHPRP